MYFQVGNAANLEKFQKEKFDGAMIINGLFHLPTLPMFNFLGGLSRISKGTILITTVNPQAYGFFASAFQEPTRTSENYAGLDPETIISGNPNIAGPENERIVLTNTPFVVMHPKKILSATINFTKLHITSTDTFGSVSMVDGPDGLDPCL